MKGCINPAVAVLNVIAIQMQVTIGCKGIVYRLQVATIWIQAQLCPFECKLSIVRDVVVQDGNVHTDVAYYCRYS